MDAPEIVDKNVQAEIQWRVRLLESLVDGHKASMELITFGTAAIEPLRDFLLNGSPSGIFQPRQWAVEALAAIGARKVLIEYLDREDPIPDPVVRHGEDAVRNSAARLICRWKTDDIFQLLLKKAQQRILPGLIAALGSFMRKEALPILEQALEDDITRPVAEEAFVDYGTEAVETLVKTVARKRVNNEEEIPASLRRRQTAAAVLSRSPLDSSWWPRLRFLLDEKDPELVVHAAKIAINLAVKTEGSRVVKALLRVLPNAPWFIGEEASVSLLALYDEGEDLIEQEIQRRSIAPPLKRASDDTLLTLMRLRQHARSR